MPLYTPIGGSWLNMAESIQRILVRRALSGQSPQNAQEVIDWLEQSVSGWDEHARPVVWNGKRRRQPKRTRLRRLGGSGVALDDEATNLETTTRTAQLHEVRRRRR